MSFLNYIVKGIGGFYYVQTADEVLECKAKGIFRKRGISPLAGDFVTLEKEGTTNVIAEIAPRKNAFVRPPVANLDVLFIVCSMTQPVPSTLIVDKMTAIAVDKGVEPVLLLTKTDLVQADWFCSLYRQSGIRVLQVNAQTGEGLGALPELIAGKICAFTGNSGVGKSTLMAALLPDLQFETGDISKKLGRGRHTTRAVELFQLYGGLVADTPGFASLDMERASLIRKENLQFAFPEFLPYLDRCRFTGCSHIGEKGCAVLEALAEGEIGQSRYESYRSMYEDAKNIKEWEL